MLKKLIDKLSRNTKDEDSVEFKPYEEEKEEIATLPEYKREEPVMPAPVDESNIELKVVRPESMEEIFAIADYLIDGITVVLNLEILDKDTIRRMLDFLNGVTYTMGGEVKNVSKGTFIATPRSGIKTDIM